MRSKVSVALFFACLVIAGPLETPWDALRHLPKHRVYTVLKFDGACVTGTFVAASGEEFELAIGQRGDESIARGDVLRISAGENADIHSTVYSARSSWADLRALQSPPYYSDLLVITSDERQFKGALLGVSGEELTLVVDHQEMKFAREYIARVFLASIKPSFERTELRHGLLPMAKKVLPTLQPVPLYEVTARQDDSAVNCTARK